MIRLTLPLATVSVANQREHHHAKARRTKTERFIADAKVRESLIGQAGRPIAPFAITLRRISPRKLDADNLASAFKAIRDGISSGLGLTDDRESATLSWKYEQETHGKLRLVEVDIDHAWEAFGGTSMAARKKMVVQSEKVGTAIEESFLDEEAPVVDAVKASKAKPAHEEPEKVFRRLPVKLTEIERMRVGQDLGKANKSVAALEVEKKNSADDYKGRIALAVGEVTKLAEICDSGIEFRDVEVHEERDHRRWEIRTVRKDTKEIVGTRSMTHQERQETLPFDGANGAAKRGRKMAGETAAQI